MIDYYVIVRCTFLEPNNMKITQKYNYFILNHRFVKKVSPIGQFKDPDIPVSTMEGI